MTTLSYLPVKPYQWRTIVPRETIPVYPPPEPLVYPPLPSPPRQLPATFQFTLSTHIIPAAHLRTLPHAPVPVPPPASSKSERMLYNEQMCARLRILGNPPVSSGHPVLLWVCLNRYVRSGAKGTGLTLFLAHANGFPKETWEPTIHSLANSPSSKLVDEIWVWEAVQHGDSALLNGENLGWLFDWADNGRDILNFLHYFLPTVLTDEPLPTHLKRVDPAETEYRQAHGLRSRTLVGVGHSYGGCTTAFAALENPNLFSSIMLVDPVVIMPYDRQEQGLADQRTAALVYGTLNRRETWPSRAEALASFEKNSFFNAWDPDVLKIYVECGLYDTQDSSGRPITKLKMPAVQEAIVFAATLAQFETYQRLKDLDERIELRWVVPGKPGAGELGAPGSTHLRVWVRPKNSSNVRVPKAGHLIPQEAPQELAHEISSFIQRKYGDVFNLKSNL